MKRLKPILSSNIYFPGLISIIVLPIAGYLYLKVYQAKYAMPVSWFDKHSIAYFSKTYLDSKDFRTFRNYRNLYLNGDHKHDLLELDTLTDFVRFIATGYGLTHGICISLTSKTRYQDMVAALDIAMYYKNVAIVPYGDQIFLFRWPVDAFKNKAKARYPDVIVLFADDVEGYAPQQSLLERISIKIHKTLHDLSPFWPCLIPLAGMIFFWRKRNKPDAIANANNYHSNPRI